MSSSKSSQQQRGFRDMGAAESLLADFDAFRKPVSFTKNRKESYRTICGGLCTILVFILLGVYLFLLCTHPIVMETIKKSVSGTAAQCNSTGGGGGGGGGGTGNETGNEQTYPPINSPLSGTMDLESTTVLNWIEYVRVKKETLYKPAYNQTYPNAPFQNGFRFGMLYNGNYNTSFFSFDYKRYNTVNYEAGAAITNLTAALCNITTFPAGVQAEATAAYMGYAYCPTSNATTFNGHGFSKNFNAMKVFTKKCTTGTCASDIEGAISGQMVSILYVDAAYDHTDISNPIKYSVNSDNYFWIDTYGRYHYNFKIRPNYVEKLDGTTLLFYSLHLVSRGYQYMTSDTYSQVEIFLDDYVNYYTQYTELQPDITPTARRALATTSESKEEEVEMSVIYVIFYICSSLGGLYTICVLVIGILLRSAVEKCFYHEIVNSTHITSKLELAKLKLAGNSSDMNMMSQGEPINLNQIHTVPGQVKPLNGRDRRSLIEDEEYKGDHHRSTKRAGSKSHRESKSKSMKRGATLKSKHSERSKSMNTKSGIGKDSNNNDRMYGTGDLLYNIFCCVKFGSHDKRSKAARNAQFQKDVKLFNKDRDLVNVISKLEMIQFKVDSIEALLNQNKAQPRAVNSSDEPIFDPQRQDDEGHRAQEYENEAEDSSSKDYVQKQPTQKLARKSTTKSSKSRGSQGERKSHRDENGQNRSVKRSETKKSSKQKSQGWE